ncbi:MAG: DUF4982 domain-containing protein [Bacteroidales bacterium]|nr:DUF4982 domain-containing protein [Bacteroidales bacterium]
MDKVRLSLVILFSCLLCRPVLAAPGYERTVNEDWSFHKDGSQVTEKVSIPHTWNAEDCTDDEPGYWRGVGWYDKTVIINENLSGRKVFVRFEGANQQTDLYVNGVHAGSHKGGYTAFMFDITGLVHPGPNAFEVRVDNSHNEGIPPMSADFTFFGGIYRDVSLLFVPENHISVEHYAGGGVYISTPEVSQSKASVHIETHLSITRPEKKLILEHIILSPDGTAVASVRKCLCKPSGNVVVQTDAVVTEPLLWDVDTPRLYTVTTRLLDRKGNAVDSRRSTFGIRTFRFDAQEGFFLNGRHLKLIGTNRHQDYKGMGNALPDGMHLRDVRLLKDMGGNFLRISHYPQDDLVPQECDRLGILGCVEIPVVNRIGFAGDFAENCENMAREMVYQSFNHPSMVAWAYMNEVLLDDSPWKSGGMSMEEYFRKVKECASCIDGAIRQADPSRPTMIPCDSNRRKYKESGLWEVPDILGFNLYYGWYYSSFGKLGAALDELHSTFPGKALFVSEYGADCDSRLHSFEPECHDYTCEFSLLFHRNYIPVLFGKDYLCGATVWNLNDFHSEARGFAVPHFNLKGLVTSDRTPKDGYWLYKALFGKGPFVRIGGADWKIRGGQAFGGVCIQPVDVFASSERVELSLNGKSLGAKPVSGGCARFDVPFTGGENILEAVGSDGARDLQRVDFRLVPEDMSLFREISVMMGTRRFFEDRTGGQIWIPEQEYKPGSWGYIGGDAMRQKSGRGSRPAFEADIAQTCLDPVFQTQRAGREAFKADVPDGEYFVYLYFADLSGPYRGKPMLYSLGNDAVPSEAAEREFSVLINGIPVLTDFNIAGEYGYHTAVIRRFTVDVEGGTGLDVSFVPSKGLPVLNAIRIVRYE